MRFNSSLIIGMALTAACVTTTAHATSSPTSTGQAITYQVDGKNYTGYYAEAAKDAPFVLLVHDWDGLTEYEQTRADMLARQGYNVFAVDMFGSGVRPTEMADKKRLTGELYDDRNKMRRLLAGALNTAQAQGNDVRDGVTMGYCFGGTVALELARSGFPQKAFVPFHGGFDIPNGQSYANTQGEILVFHGSADTSVTLQDFKTLGQTLETTGVPHEMITYSGAPHAFSVFGSERYDERADKRSWARFMGFLDELYQDTTTAAMYE